MCDIVASQKFIYCLNFDFVLIVIITLLNSVHITSNKQTIRNIFIFFIEHKLNVYTCSCMHTY